ncbi:transmembrane protein 216 isoform X1 [Ornithorhynchus anatinus]|uniref:transmembrane protein 216 isoform X1 n=1 Tax=Ornithorhynchus anatinus TaxID=9258 RepID=UPI0019D4934E|nr:transmembrane protein 216 isoform X1 [Ornithorhynchus anatinus]XP_039767328.1 transmembrane protein 216 isoform X1 [Ornithorhynchus anatinus]
MKGQRLSSTPLEILLFLNGWYSATYFLLELFVFLYKGLLLPYPVANLILDVMMLFLYLGIEVIRIFFGSKGNLCQRMVPLGISLALTFPAAMMASYYLLLQTYVLRLEAVMNAILLLFYGSEMLLQVLTLVTFYRTKLGLKRSAVSSSREIRIRHGPTPTALKYLVSPSSGRGSEYVGERPVPNKVAIPVGLQPHQKAREAAFRTE